MRFTVRRSTAMIAVAAVAASVLLLSGCSAPAAVVNSMQHYAPGALPSDAVKQFDAAVKDAAAVTGSNGAIAGVWAPWAGRWTHADGTSEPKGAALSTADSFRIGSLTKPMTCTVLLALVQKGKVRLDDPVSKYLPRMVGIGGLTLGQLCSDTSGLGDYQSQLGTQFVSNPTRPWSDVELINNALGAPKTAEPGMSWSYSNGGYVLLGSALRNATGETWQQLYQQYVIQPLGLQKTELPVSDSLPAPAPHGFTTPLDATGQPICGTRVDVTSLSPSMGPTSVGVVSDLDDVADLVHAVAKGSLLDAKRSKIQLTGVAVPGAPAWEDYAMGVELLGPLVGHAGSIPGFSTAAYSDPTSGLVVAVSLNDSTAGANGARLLALQLASIAAKIAPDAGKKAPNLSLPWTAGQAKAALAASAPCQKAAVASTDPAVIALTKLLPSN